MSRSALDWAVYIYPENCHVTHKSRTSPHSCTFPAASSCIRANIHRRWPLALLCSRSRGCIHCTRGWLPKNTRYTTRGDCVYWLSTQARANHGCHWKVSLTRARKACVNYCLLFTMEVVHKRRFVYSEQIKTVCWQKLASWLGWICLRHVCCPVMKTSYWCNWTFTKRWTARRWFPGGVCYFLPSMDLLERHVLIRLTGNPSWHGQREEASLSAVLRRHLSFKTVQLLLEQGQGKSALYCSLLPDCLRNYCLLMHFIFCSTLKVNQV